MARLLVVDDEQSMRVMLEARLAKAGHGVEVASDVAGVDRALAASEFDVVITDLRMRTGGDGLDVVRKVKAAQPEAEVILMTAFGSDDVRRQALELGAYGYVEKSPTLASELIALAKAAVHKRELARQGRILAQDNELLREQLSARGRFESMVARSGAMHQVFEVVEKVAVARTTVLITGESGVGKELVARAVHARSPRASAPRPTSTSTCGWSRPPIGIWPRKSGPAASARTSTTGSTSCRCAFHRCGSVGRTCSRSPITSSGASPPSMAGRCSTFPPMRSAVSRNTGSPATSGSWRT